MIEIFLSVNNNSEILELPVIPPEITVDKGQNSETFETASGEEFSLITSPGVVSISWNSIFPNHDYPFVRGKRLTSVFNYLTIIDEWQSQKLPVRLVISFDGEKSINIATKCVIKKYSIGTNGDMEYEIELSKIPNNLVEEELTVAQYEELLGMITDLKAKVDAYHKRFNFMQEDGFPEYAKQAAGLLYDNGALTGGEGGIDCSEDMLRLATINYRAQAYRNIRVCNYIDANMGSYQPYIQWLAENGYIKGDEDGNLNLTPDMMRVLTIMIMATGIAPDIITEPGIDPDEGLTD